MKNLKKTLPTLIIEERAHTKILKGEWMIFHLTFNYARKALSIRKDLMDDSVAPFEVSNEWC